MHSRQEIYRLCIDLIQISRCLKKTSFDFNFENETCQVCSYDVDSCHLSAVLCSVARSAVSDVILVLNFASEPMKIFLAPHVFLKTVYLIGKTRRNRLT